eukprot:CAMPEP_0170455576 /NCGR_PEP_ID=MMETSP0123-20130129/3498_1 /TAXON_ID=182087 /ORGANISM="Favella ehrenbergii, Strain Fehren 1" /LENGTH=33 /DNA_ID= /DNA_START= /DNA_END= /DNA_ORIENTATION=
MTKLMVKVALLEDEREIEGTLARGLLELHTQMV